jgi:hypothetical protein
MSDERLDDGDDDELELPEWKRDRHEEGQEAVKRQLQAEGVLD